MNKKEQAKLMRSTKAQLIERITAHRLEVARESLSSTLTKQVREEYIEANEANKAIIADKDAKIEQLRHVRHDHVMQVASLDGKCVRLNKRIDQLKSDGLELFAEVTQLHRRLSEKQDTIDQLRTEKNDALGEVANMHAKLNSKQETIDDYVKARTPLYDIHGRDTDTHREVMGEFFRMLEGFIPKTKKEEEKEEGVQDTTAGVECTKMQPLTFDDFQDAWKEYRDRFGLSIATDATFYIHPKQMDKMSVELYKKLGNSALRTASRCESEIADDEIIIRDTANRETLWVVQRRD